jgi:hypothetical protein
MAGQSCEFVRSKYCRQLTFWRFAVVDLLRITWRSSSSVPRQLAPPPMMHGVIGSRSRFIVNSIFCDWRWRQLSTSVWYRSFGKRSKYSAASFLAAVRSLVNFSRTNGPTCKHLNHEDLATALNMNCALETHRDSI